MMRHAKLAKGVSASLVKTDEETLLKASAYSLSEITFAELLVRVKVAAIA